MINRDPFFYFCFVLIVFSLCFSVNSYSSEMEDGEVEENYFVGVNMLPHVQYGVGSNSREIKVGVGRWSSSDSVSHGSFYLSGFEYKKDKKESHNVVELGVYGDNFKGSNNKISALGLFFYGVNSDLSPDRYGLGFRVGFGGADEGLKTKWYYDFTLLPEFLSTNWSGSFIEYEIRLGARHRVTRFFDVDLSYRYGAGGSTIYKTTMLSARLSF